MNGNVFTYYAQWKATVYISLLYLSGPGAHGEVPCGGVDAERDRPPEGEGSVGAPCGVATQKVDAGFYRGYMLKMFYN